jgi:hypothetical protein
MMQIIKAIEKTQTVEKLTDSIKSLISDLESENEAVIESIMDITLDHHERREKSFWEVVGNSENYAELLTLKERNNSYEYIISNLKSMIYSSYEEIPVDISTNLELKPSKKLNHGECLMWLGTKVKPLILEGITSQKEIGEKTHTPANTISQRVKRAYEKPWEEYVEFVQQGIY